MCFNCILYGYFSFTFIVVSSQAFARTNPINISTWALGIVVMNIERNDKNNNRNSNEIIINLQQRLMCLVYAFELIFYGY